MAKMSRFSLRISNRSSWGTPAIFASFIAGLTKSIGMIASRPLTREKGEALIAYDLTVL